ncbi:Speckle-type POZ protein [Orchesella cincta]|uniref:Speckle-type POZ protein n=1 Tax=Orchesella cincta TaxID=48709 RepID=A0A1D2MPC2_ORCCI|nr:Speckle-type POZ protein [Orchesella cincta]
MDFTDDVVEGMLEYIYKGEQSYLLLDKRVVDLLRIAEKYDLPDLKEDCELKIAEHVNKDNALEILMMANMNNGNYLKPRVMDYINA